MFGLHAGEPVLVVAPHPDDETLGCGGTIARLAASGLVVHVLAATCRTIASAQGCGSDPARRRVEFDSACDILGVCARRIAWVDDERARDPGAHLADLVALIESDPAVGLAAVKPAALLIPAGGSHHQDHQAVHRAARAAARAGAGCGGAPRVVLGFDGPDDRAWACRSGDWPVMVDTTDTWPIKEKALGCYGSQMRDDPHPRSTSRILAHDVAAGAAIAAGTAEQFTAYRLAF